MNNLVSKIIQMTKEKSEKYSVMYFLLFVDPEKHHYQISQIYDESGDYYSLWWRYLPSEGYLPLLTNGKFFFSHKKKKKN